MMPNQSSGSKERLIQLDVLRGVAILLVFCVHSVIDPPEAGRLQVPALYLSRIGWTGVDLFFVLSGFLIGGLLMREIETRGSLDVRRFLIRRMFKIWPTYYVYLVALVVLIFCQYGSQFGNPLRLILPNLVHLQNYPVMHRPPVAKHTWSLAVEEHFYLLLPLLLVFLTRRGTRGLRAIPWIGLGLGVICLLLRLRLHGEPFSPAIVQYPTHLRIDSLFMGVVLAYWFHLRPDVFQAIARRRKLLLIAGLALVLPMSYLFLKLRFVWTFGFTMLYLGYACLLVLFVSTPVGEGILGRWFETRSARFLAMIGSFSYSIYVWHLDFVMHPIQRWCDLGGLHSLPYSLRWLSAMLLYFTAAIVLGIVMAKLIEMPFLKLRNRLFPGRAEAIGSEEIEEYENERAIVKEREQSIHGGR